MSETPETATDDAFPPAAPETPAATRELAAALARPDLRAGNCHILSAIARPKDDGNGHLSATRSRRWILTEAADIAPALGAARAFARASDLRFRLYLTANPRDPEAARFYFRKRLTDLEREAANGHDPAAEKLKRLDARWESALMSREARAGGRFLIDIDDPDAPLGAIRAAIPDHARLLGATDTPNGTHLLTTGFNPDRELHPETDIEIKRDANIFLAFA